MKAEFLGSGWAFPIAIDQDGAILPANHEDAVRQSIWTILSTTPGERVMRPGFGCPLADVLFAANSAVTHGLVASQVRDALVDWEPRIDVLEVTVAADQEDPARLLIDVGYQVRTTNSRFNLVFPFYLQQPA